MRREAPIAAVALVRADGAVLLQLRDDKPEIVYPGLWVFPGGHGRVGETPRACARREFLEETGYNAGGLEPLGDMHDPRESAPNPIQLFADRYDGDQPLECLEGRELRFVDREEAERLAMPQFLLDAWDELVLPYISTASDRLEATI